MFCIWEVKAGVACLQVKMCMLPHLSALENATVFEGALQMSRFTLLFTFITATVRATPRPST